MPQPSGNFLAFELLRNAVSSAKLGGAAFLPKRADATESRRKIWQEELSAELFQNLLPRNHVATTA